MKKTLSVLLAGSICAYAHFGTILPSKNVVEKQENSKISISFSFMHPFMQTYMMLEKPEKIGVFSDGKVQDLSGIVAKKGDSWVGSFEINKPAMFSFFMEPKPYFEPSEGKFIKHLTKTIVEGYGAGEGWDKPIGLKAEIVPLTRPYGLYEGNLFQGKVMYKGKVVKNAEVEVEFYNTKKFKAPSEAHVTQVVKSDELTIKGVDLFFIGLVLEYVNPEKALEKVIKTIDTKGVLFIVIQKNEGTSFVSKTKYSSLTKLAEISKEVDEIEIDALIQSKNMKLIKREKVELTKNKFFITLEYQMKE